MTDKPDAPFKEKLIEEFEANLNRIFGCDIARFKEVTRDKGELDTDIDELWEAEGAQSVRKMLGQRIVFLHSIFTERDMGRRLTFDEFVSNSISLDVGLEEFDREGYRNTFPATIFEANRGVDY